MEEEFSHFSHRHPLKISDILDEEDQVICSGCEHDLSGGSAYTCTKNNCNFILHDSCFELPRQIKHKSHPKHTLSLLLSSYNDGEYMRACGNSGHAFTFHCEKCKFDLHVECASLPEIEEREDHQHPLTLCYSNLFLGKGDEVDVMCYVCKRGVGKTCWFYYCLACKCGAHLDCVANQEIVVSEI
ncbi:LOW QUALITY PROTEIN: protein VACUOLELESS GAMETOPHYTES-like [Lycium ferocissimum]|uniref:LOW QUALITY PROTEIN: protein VACUOLELESS GAMETOPHYTES-like n=1 Tax=Lycium ferocissimum TaxID=112874 RepID=UPI0028165106|nr:LOW QUALITY PROTEIN: protein VACUOLELESS GAMETOPHYTES-like [Lycium ferocissimum]